MVVELLHRPNQPHVALLDQVQERHAAADVLLGDRDHQSEVGLGQPVLGVLVPLLDQLGQVDLVLGLQQRDPADLLEVHPNRVVQGDGIGFRRQHIFVGLLGIEVLVAVRDDDPHLPEDDEEPLHLVGVGIQFGERLHDLVGREEALFLPLQDQLFREPHQILGARRARRRRRCLHDLYQPMPPFRRCAAAPRSAAVSGPAQPPAADPHRRGGGSIPPAGAEGQPRHSPGSRS